MLGEGLPLVRHVKSARSPSVKVRLLGRVLSVSSVVSGASVRKGIRPKIRISVRLKKKKKKAQQTRMKIRKLS